MGMPTWFSRFAAIEPMTWAKLSHEEDAVYFMCPECPNVLAPNQKVQPRALFVDAYCWEHRRATP